LKATRRHDLKENELARDLGRAGEFIRRYLQWLVGGLVAIVVIIAIIFYASHRRQADRQEHWQRFAALSAIAETPRSDIAGLRLLAEQTPQKALAAWAYVKLGESIYSELRQRHCELDEQARQILKDEAREAFTTVLSQYGVYSEAVGQANLGLARLAENDGQFDAAREAYQQVLDSGSRAGLLALQQAGAKLQQLKNTPRHVEFAASAPAESAPEQVPAADTQPADEAGAPHTRPTTGPAAQLG